MDEDEYFPLPRELREVLRRLATAAAISGLAPGGDPTHGEEVLPDDRSMTASAALASARADSADTSAQTSLSGSPRRFECLVEDFLKPGGEHLCRRGDGTT